MVAAALKPVHGRVDTSPERLVHTVHAVFRLLVHQLQPTLDAEGISVGQFWALKFISSRESASVGSVARHLSVSSPTVCSNVDQLEEAGLLVRHRSDRDRREVDLSLTPKGRRLVGRLWAQVGVMMSEAVADLPAEDLTAAIRVFETLQARLDGGVADHREAP